MSQSRSPRPKRMTPKRNTDMENYRLSEEGKLLWEAFEKVKPRMCGHAAKLTIEAMEEHREYRDRTGPSSHPFYARIKGKGQIDDPERYYYPYLLVIQTIWPESHHVQTIAVAFSRYWGADLWRGPEYYPMLNDRDREMELFMGKKPRETEARQDESSTGNGEDNGEEGEDIKQEDTEEQEQLQEDEQDQQLEEEQNEDEQQREGNEDMTPDAPDIDANTSIKKLDEVKDMLENREKELMEKVHETKELIRKVQEVKRDHFKEKSRASKKTEERLLKKVEARRKISDHWAAKEREYTEKLQRSSDTSSAISPPPEQEAERPAKRRRVVEPEE